ncbi:MAG: hypothetical protein HY428_00040 [Candidatus Levybacteria bacterium]|nr:hypothetical protein [Candidatus Levybacteria bacterium]
MLTKNDLQEIQKIVKTESDSVRTDLRLELRGTIAKELKPIKDDVENIKNDIKTVKKEIKPIKSMQRDIRKMKKNTETMLGMLNRDDMRLQKRVKLIEEHLGFPPQQN